MVHAVSKHVLKQGPVISGLRGPAGPIGELWLLLKFWGPRCMRGGFTWVRA